MKHCVLIALFSLIASGTLPAQIVHPSVDLLDAPKTTPMSADELDRLQPQDNYSLPWKSIKEEDILWRQRVWREIDIADPANAVMATTGTSASYDLLGLLYKGLQEGAFKAYTTDNDRFVHSFTEADIKDQVAKLVGYARDKMNSLHITHYAIKEDYIFLKDEQTLVIRIVGIAPESSSAGAGGKIVTAPLFWLYYPETRTYLSKCNVAAGATPGLNWDQYFEGRKFKGAIVKTSQRGDYKRSGR